MIIYLVPPCAAQQVLAVIPSRSSAHISVAGQEVPINLTGSVLFPVVLVWGICAFTCY